LGSIIKINAKRLLNDARFLFKDERYPTACSLGVLVIEEVGKLPILRRMALAQNTDQWKLCWKDFSNHLAKSIHWIIPFLVKESETFEDLRHKYQQQFDADLLNSLKQFGFYLGCYGNAHWGEPEKIIEKNEASPIMHAAEVLAFGSQPSEFDSPAALKAWTTHMSGYFKCDSILANNLVVDFFKTAHALGIKKEDQKIPPQVAFEFMSTVMYLSS